MAKKLKNIEYVDPGILQFHDSENHKIKSIVFRSTSYGVKIVITLWPDGNRITPYYNKAEWVWDFNKDVLRFGWKLFWNKYNCWVYPDFGLQMEEECPF